MPDMPEICPALPGDLDDIARLYPDAFPDEDLLPLVSALVSEQSGVLSLIAVRNGLLCGHVCFTRCQIAARESVALLGPLAVAPRVQRTGVGSALVRAGLVQMRECGASQVNVLGDPEYYVRFGFQPDRTVRPPYPIPEEWGPAWQCLRFGTGDPFSGKLEVPRPWQDAALWAP